MKWIAAAIFGALLVLATVVLVGSKGATSQPVAVPPDASRNGPDAPSPLTIAVRLGQSVRIPAPDGVIHVWRPAGYRPETAATIVYVHGYYTDVDGAWQNHQLPEQFANSAVNGLFIAPEAPDGPRQAVHYRDLGELLRAVEADLGEPRPSGPLIVLGHSGGYRTLMQWIDYPLIDTVILIDALYGDLEDFRRWLEHGAARRLVTIGDDTLRWTEDFARSIPGTVEIDRVPPMMDLWPPEARTARHLYIRSQYGHMTQVTGDLVLPMVLRLESVELLADAPWTHPLGELPALPDAAVDATPPTPPPRRRR